MNEKTRKNIGDIARDENLANTTEVETNRSYARKCLVCETIEIQGFMIPKGKYDEQALISQGTQIANPEILSNECFSKIYGYYDGMMNERSKVPYKTCKPKPKQTREITSFLNLNLRQAPQPSSSTHQKQY